MVAMATYSSHRRNNGKSGNLQNISVSMEIFGIFFYRNV